MSDELREYVERVSQKVRLHAAILFGSRARGDHGPWSDYDLLLIGDFKEPYLDRLKTLPRGLGSRSSHIHTPWRSR